MQLVKRYEGQLRTNNTGDRVRIDFEILHYPTKDDLNEIIGKSELKSEQAGFLQDLIRFFDIPDIPEGEGWTSRTIKYAGVEVGYFSIHEKEIWQKTEPKHSY